MTKDIVRVFIVRQRISDDAPYEVYVGTRWHNPTTSAWNGSASGIPVRFDTLPRARSVAKFLRDTYKAMGHKVECNLRPQRG